MTVLRQGLLDGRGVALAGGVPAAIGQALTGLGARVHGLEPRTDEDAVQALAAAAAPLDALVFDAAPAFAGGGQVGLTAALEAAWVATRGVAARYGVTTVAILPGSRTSDDELAELVCFMISPAGEYFSGCLFELGLDSLIRTS